MREKLKKICIAALWLAVWQIAALRIDNDILLAGPAEVLHSIWEMAAEPFVRFFTGAKDAADFYFYKICWSSLKRILLGFALAFVTGGAFGALSYRFRTVREITEPVLAVMKSIPVASFVVLLLIWQGSENLSVWISFFVVFPNLCVSTRSGLEAVDPGLKEMAEVFGIRGIKRAVFLYRPSLLHSLRAGMEISIGMAFKSGVAAEVIGLPEYSLGERIYVSKIYLDTPGLFAWTVSLIFLSFAVEKLILRLMDLAKRPVGYGRKTYGGGNTGSRDACGKECGNTGSREEAGKESGAAKRSGEERGTIRLSHISKSFGEKTVLCDISAELKPGGRYLLMGPSGSGKTTLLRILAGLEQPDQGRVQIGTDPVPGSRLQVSYQFQEDRLLENEFTITNIMLPENELSAGGTPENALSANDGSRRRARTRTGVMEGWMRAAAKILPESCLRQPAAALSGGMKRRCALARALFYQIDNPGAVCLLDEPFAGLDEATKEKAAAFIGKYLNGRTLIVATHDEKDAALLGGSIWRIAE